MKGNLMKHARSLGCFVNKHSNVILTVGTVFGICTIVYTTAKATLKIKEDVENLQYEKDDVTKKDVAKVVVKDGLPVIFTVVTTGTMTICNGIENGRKIRAAAALYEACEYYKDYAETFRSKVREKYGEKAEREVDAEIAKDKYGPNYIPESIYDTGEGDILFIESKSGRVLRASREYIRRCEKEFNQLIRGEDWLSFNNWLNCLGVRMMDEDFGDLLGFREIYDHYALNVDFIPSNEIFPSGETATLIVYKDDLCTEGDRRCFGY